MNRQRLLILGIMAALLVLVAVWYVRHGHQWFSLSVLREHLDAVRQEYARHPLQLALLFCAGYTVVAVFALPGGALLTLFAGAVFGVLDGVMVVSLGSTLGAMASFALTRWLLRDFVGQRFRTPLAVINRGMAQEGAFYLAGLRLVPLFPYFLINWLMALTSIRFTTYAWVTWLTMLPGTVLYVNAGQQLAALQSVRDVLSLPMFLSLLALGVFPLLAKRLVGHCRAWRVLRAWPKPLGFDANLVVIGAGAAGLVSAVIGSTVKARVVLIERERMGGDCLNTGCVPSKTLLASAQCVQRIRDAGRYGVHTPAPVVDFAAVMARVQSAIRTIEPHDSVERFTGLGVECVQGDARIVSPWAVQVGDRTITTRAIVIASGARPAVPAIPGIEQTGFVTSETVWQLPQLPQRLLVLGAGPVGCELAQAFARLGSRVTLVSREAQILPREDADVAQVLHDRLLAEGVVLHTGVQVRGFEGRVLVAQVCEEPLRLGFDTLLVATGRRPRTEGLGLEALGIACTAHGTIEVDETLRTHIPTIYACGDVAGPYQFTHMAAHQAWTATVNALFGHFRRFVLDDALVPWVVYSDPPVARVGLSEGEAARQGIAVDVTRLPFAGMDRAVAEGETTGFTKVLTAAGTDRILGVSIVGSHAGEMLGQWMLAMKHNLGLNALLGTLQAYPSWAEAPRLLAGAWKRERAPQRLLAWVGRYHRWRRQRD